MSWRRELGEIRRERDDLIRREAQLRTDLEWRFGPVLLYGQIALQLFSLVGRIVNGRRARRRLKR